jgi:hypothetical protein
MPFQNIKFSTKGEVRPKFQKLLILLFKKRNQVISFKVFQNLLEENLGTCCYIFLYLIIELVFFDLKYKKIFNYRYNCTSKNYKTLLQ